MAPDRDVTPTADATVVLDYATPVTTGERAGAVVWIAATLVWLASALAFSIGSFLLIVAAHERDVDPLVIGCAMIAVAIFEAFAAWQSAWRGSAGWAKVVAVSAGVVAGLSVVMALIVATREPMGLVFIVPIHVCLPAFVSIVHARWASARSNVDG